MTSEVILFAVFAVTAVGGALVMVGSRNPVHSALGLLTTMFSISVFYVMNGAYFVAAIQVLIYAGAVMTLFLFVIMLIGVDRTIDRSESIPFQRPVAIVLGLGLLALIYVAARAAWVTGTGTGAEATGTIENISEQLFDAWLIPFEATILLLTIAAVGTVALAQYFGVMAAPESDAASVATSEAEASGDEA